MCSNIFEDGFSNVMVSDTFLSYNIVKNNIFRFITETSSRKYGSLLHVGV